MVAGVQTPEERDQKRTGNNTGPDLRKNVGKKHGVSILLNEVIQ
jgi:hypothetical protein